MNKAEIYDLLRTRGIWHEITEHKAVYNMAELTDVALPYPEADAKNLFVRDDKKRNYDLITVRGDKRVDLKEFRHKYGTRALSFASENDLMQVLGLIPGAVTPLGACRYAECLLAAGAGAALHLYPSGGHGFGLRREFAWREALVGELRMWLDATIGTV